MAGTLQPMQKEAYSQDKVPPLVDSKEKQLDIGNIVVIATYHTKSEAPPNQVAMSILLELQQPSTVQQIIGNTLFIAHESDEKGHFIFRALNADTAQNYKESAKRFITFMKDNGAVELATQFNDKRILRLIKIIAEEMLKDDNTPLGYRAYHRDGEYLVAIKLNQGVQQ